MQKKNVLFLVCTLCLSVIGIGLRVWMVKTGFDTGGALAIEHNLPTVLLMVLSVAAVAVLWLLGRKYEGEQVSHGRSTAGTALGALGGALTAVGAILFWRAEIALGTVPVYMTALMLVGVLAGMLSLVSALVRGMGRESNLTRSLCLPASLFACFALIVCYKVYSNRPTELLYCWEVLGLSAGAYAFYAAPACRGGLCKVRCPRLWNGWAVFFLAVCIGGGHKIGVTLCFAGLLLMALGELLFPSLPAEEKKTEGE